jgi:hypothetical protein
MGRILSSGRKVLINAVPVNVKYYFISPSTRHYRPISARFHGVASVKGSMVRRDRVNFIRRES